MKQVEFCVKEVRGSKDNPWRRITADECTCVKSQHEIARTIIKKEVLPAALGVTPSPNLWAAVDAFESKAFGVALGCSAVEEGEEEVRSEGEEEVRSGVKEREGRESLPADVWSHT